jgi:hypothetical protein
MTVPEQYVPKTPTQVTAMQFNAYDGTSIDVKEWIESLLTVEDENNYVIYGPLSDRLFVQNGDFSLEVEHGQYVYLDEDGFHVVNKGTFELVYKKDIPA